MSFKTKKRREQRLRVKFKIKFWKDVRQDASDRAFEEWKQAHVGQIRKEYLYG